MTCHGWYLHQTSSTSGARPSRMNFTFAGLNNLGWRRRSSFQNHSAFRGKPVAVCGDQPGAPVMSIQNSGGMNRSSGLTGFDGLIRLPIARVGHGSPRSRRVSENAYDTLARILYPSVRDPLATV